MAEERRICCTASSASPQLSCQLRSLLTVQDDGTFADDGDSPAVAPSPGSVSLGTDSSEDEDDEDGDAREHRMNVRTGQSPPPITFGHA